MVVNVFWIIFLKKLINLYKCFDVQARSVILNKIVKSISFES